MKMNFIFFVFVIALSMQPFENVNCQSNSLSSDPATSEMKIYDVDLALIYGISSFLRGLSVTLPPPLNFIAFEMITTVSTILASITQDTTSNIMHQMTHQNEEIRRNFDFLQNQLYKTEFHGLFKPLRQMIVESQGGIELLRQLYSCNFTNRGSIDKIFDKYFNSNFEVEIWKHITDQTVPGSFFETAVEYSMGLLDLLNLGLKSSPRKFLTSLWSTIYLNVMAASMKVSIFIEIQKNNTGGKYT